MSVAAFRSRVATLVEAITPETLRGGSDTFRRYEGTAGLEEDGGGSGTDRMFEVEVDPGPVADYQFEPEEVPRDGTITVRVAYLPELGDLDATRDRMAEDATQIADVLQRSTAVGGLHGYSSGGTAARAVLPGEGPVFRWDVDEEGAAAFYLEVSVRVIHSTRRT